MQSDKEWWAALQAGEEDALAHIYTTYIDDLLQYGQRFSQDVLLVEDCIQELFVQLWKKRSNLGETSSIRAYLLVALRRSIFRAVKKKMQHISNKSPEDYDFQAELAVEDMIIAEEVSKEQSEQLAAAFEELSKRQREVLYLRFYQEMDYEDICEIMDLGYQSVRNLVSAAINRLRTYLELIILICYFFTKNAVQNGLLGLFL